MQHVILFGGGDAGGILITANGIRRIPPWNPDTRELLRGVAALSRALPALKHAGLSEAAEGLMNRALTVAGKQVEGVTGPLDAATTVTFLASATLADVEDGFVCGTPWRHPLPVPGPRPGPVVVGPG